MFDNENDELASMYVAQPGLQANPNAPARQSFRDKLLQALAAQYRPQMQAGQVPTGIKTEDQIRAEQTQQAMGNIGRLLRGLF